MSSISNRFFVTALEDGTTLHGALASDKTVTQGWDGSAASPDWSIATNQPTIYLTLTSGNTPVVASSTYEWKYNGATLTFDSSTGISTGTFAGLFKKVTHSSGNPAIMIINNLANSDNVDLDTLTLEGSWNAGGNTYIPFSASMQIRITSIGAAGYFGVVDFANGISNFTEHGQNVTMFVRLYSSGGGNISPNDYTTEWYINGTRFSTLDFPHSQLTTYTEGGTIFYALSLNEEDVTDNAIIRADIKLTGESDVIFTAYANVDDLQDPEYLYIQYNGANGQAATLRQGEFVEFYMWVGRADDPTIDTSFGIFKLKLLDADGDIIWTQFPNGDTIGLKNPDANGWRDGLVELITNKCFCKINYDIVNSNGKNITCIVLAQQGSAS